MKYFYKLALLALVLVASVSTQAAFTDTIKVDSATYALDTDEHVAEITGVSEYYVDRRFNIPASIQYGGDNYPVTSIGRRAFYGRNGFRAVSIPESVTSIDREAFSQCTNLIIVSIPNSVTSIGVRAFFRCSSLTSVSIPNSVTSIGDEAFYGCSGLTSVSIPNSVTSISKLAFARCSGLTSVSIPNSVTSISGSAFSGCSSLTSVSIPNSVTFIGESAFLDCSGLTKAEFASIESLCSIKFDIGKRDPRNFSNPLRFAHNLYINGDEVKDLVIPNDVDSIGDYAFYGCSGLTSVTIPSSVKYIGNSAFEDCSGLTKADFASVESLCTIKFGVGGSNPINNTHNLYINGQEVKDLVIPNDVDSIGDYAFYGCSGLTSVTIPSSVKYIGNSAFDYCRSLTKADFASVESLCSIEFSNKSGYRYSYSNPICYTHKLYINGEEVKDLVIPNDVVSIGDYAFQCCSGLTSVTIPNSVKYIGNRAFEDCSGLTSVTIPYSVKYIGNSAFEDCSGLTKADFASVESLCTIKFGDGGSNPINNTHNLYINGEELKDLVIPNDVDSIGDYAFYGCSGLTSVTIGSSVSSIGGDAFVGCSELNKVVCRPLTPPSISSTTFDRQTQRNAVLYYPIASENDYLTAKVWREFVKAIDIETDTKRVATDRTSVREVARFTADGRCIFAPEHGVNIVRYSDGSVRKVVVK